LGAGAKVEELCDEIPPWRDKNRDDLSRFFRKSGKQFTHIVRVTGCCYFPFEVRKLILSHVF
jgi:hypothetical protein